MKLNTRSVSIAVVALVGMVLAVMLASNAGGTSPGPGADATPTAWQASRPEKVFVAVVSYEDYPKLRDFEAVGVCGNQRAIWLEMSNSQYQKLRESGVAYQDEQSDYFTLKFFDYRFDPLIHQPELPPDLTSSYAPGTPGTYIIQWCADVQDTWRETLKSMGVTILDPDYLVRMTPEQADKVRALDFVRWVGVYHAAYRIRPAILKSTNAVEKITLRVYDDGQVNGSVDHLIETLEGLGGELLSNNSPYTKGHSTTRMIFNLPAQKIVQAAQLNDVVMIDAGPSNQIEGRVLEE